MDGAIGVLVRYGYVVVFGSVLAEQIGLPIPAVPLLLAAGGLAGASRLDPVVLLASAGIASLLADTVWYWIGRTQGARVLGWLCRISLEPDSCVRRTQRIFSTIAPPLAGIIRMPFREFLVVSGLGGVLWAGAFVAVGWVFSQQLELAAEYALRFGRWSLAGLAAAIAGYIAWKYVGRQRFLRQIRIARISPEELKRRLDEGVDMLVVDVRDRLDFEAEPSIIPGALHLTLEELEDRHHEIPREREIVLYCT